MQTSRDIARLAGVSQATVSRVLANNPKVREETRQKVLAVLDSTAYVPNAQARAMRSRRSGTIGVVTGKILNPFYPELIGALGSVLTGHDRRMVLWSSDTDAGELAAIDAMRAGLVDGVVFTSAASDSDALHSALASALPVVLVVRSIEGARCDQVTSDNAAGGRLAAQHFLAAGRPEVAVIGGTESVSTSRERRAGFLTAMADDGVVMTSERIVDCDFTHEAARTAATALLSTRARPQAVFCVNDITALGVLDAAAALGLAVPQDLWVIGYDDIAMASWNLIGLTTLTQPVHRMAEVGVEMLLRRLDDPHAPYEHRRFMPELVIRRTAPHLDRPPASAPSRPSKANGVSANVRRRF